MHPLLSTLLLSIGLNLFVFLFAYKKQSDHFTDFTYSLTFILVALLAFFSNDVRSAPKLVLLFMIIIWAIRLGGYLASRIQRIGVDHRFDDMRPVWHRYIKFWILQGGSVWILATPFIIALSSGLDIQQLQGVQVAGVATWLIGFLLETIADFQKSKFRNNADNKGQFMQRGLFSIIQYPNYLGEILVWIGVFMFSTPYLNGIEWLSVVSPIWIMVLLLFISGIPYLVKSSERRYGHMKAYQLYKEKTRKLIPFIY